MTDPTSPQTVSLLLTTKLHRPRSSAPLVPRPRLLKDLTAGLSQRLTLISAPAGYGKTTLVSQWLDSVNCPCAWISLDEHDTDLAAFLSHLLAAVRSVYPDAGRATELLLTAPTLSAPGRLADSLLHDLIALPGELILVLDDYHTLQTQDVHLVMTRLLQHMPAHVHLILTTRADPPLPLERLRGRQQLAEIRSADLSFTPEEARQLLRQILGETATDETAALLEESTEGWPVGLQLAAISLRGRSNPAAFARKIAQGGHRLVADYLLAEVLEVLPDALRTYLLQTSLLDRFCAPLCDAVRGEACQELTGEDFLRAVQRSNLFLVPLDDEGTWFRYHHLFQYLLRNRLRQVCTTAETMDMHARASAWFAVHGLFDEAIAHAVKAGDIEAAAALVEDQVHPSLDREDWRQVERWLGLLPEEVRNRPRLLVAQAWLGYVRYQFSSIATLLAAAEAALASNPAGSQATATMLRGEISTLRAAIAYGQDDAEEMEQWAQAALQELRPDMAYATGLAKYFHITALHGTGRYAAAVEFAHRQIEDSYARQANSAALRPLLALNNIHYEMADLSALKVSAEMLLQITRHEEYGLSTAWAHDILGWVHYQRNELAEAEARFRRVVLIAASAHGRAVVDGYTGLVLTALAQGRPQEALNAIATLRELLLERGMLAYSLVADSLQQRVALAGDPSSVSDWRLAGSTAKIPVEFWVQPALTQVRTLLTGGSRHGLAEATEMLAVCRAQASERHSRRRLIEVDALQALVHAAEGDEAAALATLRQAVELAAPGGTLRILVDCGPGLIGPLQKLQAEGVAPGYIQQVLAAYGASVVPAAAASSSQHPATQAATSGIRVEMLTNREIDVLILLAERLSDKEIAARLVLSPETIKKHTAHIYRKLGVDNRRAAAACAHRLNLL